MWRHCWGPRPAPTLSVCRPHLLSWRSQGSDKLASRTCEVAARSGGNAFADFLFDLFKDGVNAMVRNFADALQRMAADRAAAEVLDFLVQKVDWDNVSGTIASGAISLIGGVLAACPAASAAAE